MSAGEEHVTGLADLQKFLDQLAPTMEAKYMRGALRAGMKVVRPVAQGMIHSVSGMLARGLKIGSRLKGHVVTAYMRATGEHASVAIWLEYGTAAHVISGRVSGWLAFSGVFRKRVEHPGFRARPFMRPALDTQASAAVVAVGNYLKRVLATKQGFLTGSIEIEAEE